MRNIFEYPITLEETMEMLKQFQKEEENKKQIGSLNQIILSTIEEFLLENSNKFETFCLNNNESVVKK